MLKFLVCLFALFSFDAFAGTVSGKVNWQATGNPGFLRINGTGGQVDGDVKHEGDKVSGVFKVKLADFSTGMSLRDDHMRNKFLEVAKFPYATLTLDPVVPSASFTWTGKLEMKGQTEAVNGTGSVQGQKFTAKFSVAMKDYPAIGVPEHLGVTVADKVDVTVEGEVK